MTYLMSPIPFGKFKPKKIQIRNVPMKFSTKMNSHFKITNLVNICQNVKTK